MVRRGFIFAALSALGLVACGHRAEVQGIQTQDGDGSEATPYTDRIAHGPLDRVSTPLLYARSRVALQLQLDFPSFSTCGRCRWPWAVVRLHSTHFDSNRGMFPLCEDCWTELQTPEDRMPYYDALIAEWDEPSIRDAVHQAVEDEAKK